LLERVQQLEAAAAEGAAAARRAAEMSAAAEAAAERERALQAQVEGAAARSLDKGALTAVLQAEQSRLKDALAAATMSGATLNDALRAARAELDTAHAQLAASKARCESAPLLPFPGYARSLPPVEATMLSREARGRDERPSFPHRIARIVSRALRPHESVGVLLHR